MLNNLKKQFLETKFQDKRNKIEKSTDGKNTWSQII